MDEISYYCYIKTGDIPDGLELITLNAKSHERVLHSCYSFQEERILKFFKETPDMNDGTTPLKAVILNVFDYENKNLFKSNSEFLHFIIPIFKEKKISFRFISKYNFNLTLLLKAASNIMQELSENIVVLYVGKNEIFVDEIYRTSEGYMLPKMKDIQKIEISDNFDPVKIKAAIRSSVATDTKFLLTTTKIYSKELWIKICQMMEKHNDIIYLENVIVNKFYQNQAIIEMSKHLLNEKENKQCHIIPRFTYVVRNINQQDVKLIECNFTIDTLPFTKKVFDQRGYCKKYCIEKNYNYQKESEILQRYPPLQIQHHKIEITLKIDTNMLPYLLLNPFIITEIENLPKKLTAKIGDSSKIPIIGFFDNSSVICIWNVKEKCYKFADNWNGLYGENLYLSFDEEKPKFRNEAMSMLKEKPTSVVYDIMLILGTDISDLSINPNWSFTITKNDENPIMIKFDDFDGTQKLATPEFLMALLLKDHKKAIRKEIGQKPKEIGAVFFDKNDEIKCPNYSLLEKRFKKSCELLKIGCKIVSLDD